MFQDQRNKTAKIKNGNVNVGHNRSTYRQLFCNP
jgi:hypothetical protein